MGSTINVALFTLALGGVGLLIWQRNERIPDEKLPKTAELVSTLAIGVCHMPSWDIRSMPPNLGLTDEQRSHMLLLARAWHKAAQTMPHIDGLEFLFGKIDRHGLQHEAMADIVMWLLAHSAELARGGELPWDTKPIDALVKTLDPEMLKAARNKVIPGQIAQLNTMLLAMYTTH